MANYVVAGATGRVGSIVAAALLARHETVTVIVRDEARGLEWAKRGAEVAVGSLDDRAFVAHVVHDAAGFFTLLPENVAPDDFHGARRRMADAVARGVQEGRVPHVVMLSAMAASLPDGNGPAKDLHYCERQLTMHVKQLTMLRACYFQDNVSVVVPAAVRAGIYPNFLASADAPIPMVATRDVGRCAAEALLNPPPRTETIDLFGPSYTIRQLLASMSWSGAPGCELSVHRHRQGHHRRDRSASKPFCDVNVLRRHVLTIAHTPSRPSRQLMSIFSASRSRLSI